MKQKSADDDDEHEKIKPPWLSFTCSAFFFLNGGRELDSGPINNAQELTLGGSRAHGTTSIPDSSLIHRIHVLTTRMVLAEGMCACAYAIMYECAIVK